MAERYEAGKEKGIIPYLDAYDYADLTDWYVMRQQIAQAEEALEDGLSIHPDSEALLIEKCHLLLDNGDLTGASKLSKRLDACTSDPAIILKGCIALQQGHPRKAKKLFDTISDKDEMYNIIDICYAYLENERWDDAVIWLRKGRQKYDNEEPFVALKADYYFHGESYQKAINCYNLLIDTNPYSPVYWTGIARCYLALEEFGKAIEACDYALVSDENYQEALHIKAQSFGALGNTEEAYNCYKKLFEMGALPLGAWNDIEVMYLMQNAKYEEAYKQLKRLEKESGKEISNNLKGYRAYNMGLCLMEMMKIEDAYKCFKKAIKLQPSIVDAYLQGGITLALLDREEEALLTWEKAIKVSPCADTLFNLGRATMQVGYLSMSLKSFLMAEDMAIDEEDELPLVREHIAFIYLLKGDRPKFEEKNRTCRYAIPDKVIPEMYKNIDKADAYHKIEVAHRYFERYVLAPSHGLDEPLNL